MMQPLCIAMNCTLHHLKAVENGHVCCTVDKEVAASAYICHLLRK
jgi:hypothetical protein